MISIVYPYFDQPKVLVRHCEQWRNLGKLAEIEVILVDDHSPKWDLSSEACLFKPDERLRIFRVDEDLGWNITGAKNIGMHHAEGDWCFVGDLDHLVTQEMLEWALHKKDWHAKHSNSRRGDYYIFPRRLENGRESNDYHENFLLIRNADFWKVGGYDEDFAGGWGWEDGWFNQLAKELGLKRIKVKDVYSQALGDISDACMPAEMRDGARNGKLLQRKRTAWINSRRAKLFACNTNPLRCKYHEVK